MFVSTRTLRNEQDETEAFLTTSECGRPQTEWWSSDSVVGPKKAQVTKTESDNPVEDPDEGEAEDAAKQESKEEEKDATMEVEVHDLRMAALEPRALGDLESHLQFNSSRFPAHDDLRKVVLACAELRTRAIIREVCRHRMRSTRIPRARTDSLERVTQLRKLWTHSFGVLVCFGNAWTGCNRWWFEYYI